MNTELGPFQSQILHTLSQLHVSHEDIEKELALATQKRQQMIGAQLEAIMPHEKEEFGQMGCCVPVHNFYAIKNVIDPCQLHVLTTESVAANAEKFIPGLISGLLGTLVHLHTEDGKLPFHAESAHATAQHFCSTAELSANSYAQETNSEHS